jgi:cytochrome c oxidase cbb3-type subunit 3
VQDLFDEIRTTIYLEGVSVIIFIGVMSVLMLLALYRLLYAGANERLGGVRLTSAGVILAVLLVLPLPILFMFRPGVSPTQAVGEIIYQDECAVCHGDGGNRLPDIALGSEEYLMTLGDAALERAIREGVGVMPAWGRAHEGPLSDEEIRLIVDYLKSNARTGEQLVTPGELPGAPPEPAGTPSAEAGAQLFANNCTACHGDKGSRIPAADLSSKAFLDARDDADLAKVIGQGKGGMPGFSVEREGPLTSTDIQSIVAFLRTLGQEQ